MKFPQIGSSLKAKEPKNEDIEKILAEVQVLDPELLENTDARKLVELGAKYIAEITEAYGTPDQPKWVSGTVENHVFMSYHNGGSSGHTSIGSDGSGVPRNVLIIAKKVNETAKKEIYNTLARAVAFYAATAHDRYQLCGRMLLPEGQGAPDKGDERLSAEHARQRYLEAGGDEATAMQIYLNIAATAFNPETGRQNVDYFTWKQRPDDPALSQEVLCQELVAAADLMGITSKFATVNSIAYVVESMNLNRNNRIIYQCLQGREDIVPLNIKNMGQMLAIIGNNETLRPKFVELMNEEEAFIRDKLQFSDDAIWSACGKKMDELFSDRKRNAVSVGLAAQDLRNGATPLMIWQQAKHKADLLS